MLRCVQVPGCHRRGCIRATYPDEPSPSLPAGQEAPPDSTSVSSADLWHWERACTRLVTVVADRTQAESGWYGHCMQVLRWFLAYNGIDEGQTEEIVKNAVGGRFGSWIAPDVSVVDAVSSRFARGVGGIR